MKVRINTREDQDYRIFLDIYVTDTRDKDQHLSFWDGEPEDNTLNRNFNDCFLISSLMDLAFQAGAHGETFELEYTEREE